MSTVKSIATPAQFLPLKKQVWNEYAEHLDAFFPESEYALSLSAMEGPIGIQEDMLQKAARIVEIFQRACQSLHANLPHKPQLREQLLHPLTPLPHAKESAKEDPFFLKFLRMDFFLCPTGGLKIIEVNSCGGGMMDYLRSVSFLKKHYPFSPPKDFHELNMEVVLECLMRYVQKHKPTMKTIGLGAKENGCEDYICDYAAYAQWIRKNTDIQPVLLELKKGELSLLDHPDCPPVIAEVTELDAIFCDWFEDIPCLENVERLFRENDILVVPPRSDILFENKSFLSKLKNLQKPEVLTDSEWDILQEAILPSFPLRAFEEHFDEIKQWPGVVLKMDIDCASENVFIFDRKKMEWDDIHEALAKKKEEITKGDVTWTLQRFLTPPHIPLEETPSWIDLDYKPYKYDLMTYFLKDKNKNHVLFGTRGFSREKIDELTDAGREDGVFSPACAL